MSYNLPKQLTVFPTLNLVNVLATGETTLFTPSHNFFIYNFYYTLVDLQGGTPTISNATLGYNSPTYDNIAPTLTFSFTSENETSLYPSPLSMNLIPAGSTLKVLVTVADTGPTTELYSINLVGFYF